MPIIPPRSRRGFLFAGLALILLALILWRPLQQQCAAYFLLRSEAPSREALSATVEQAGDPAPLLLRLWKTRRIPHRQFVLAHLSTASTTSPALVSALEPILLEAAADPDISVRESAFATLARARHPRLRPLALQQLSDADPAARLIALQNLRTIATSNDVPVVMRLLDDPEPRVVVAAALLLRQATGQDFGIRSTHAMPQFTCIETNPPPPPNLAAISQGVRRWHEWWTTNQTADPTPPAPPTSSTQAPVLPTAEFTLTDSNGKPVRLSQFRGKSVLLAFWSPGAPASLDDVPALNNVQHHNADRLAVLAICTPLPPDCCAEEHQHGDNSAHEHAHHHHSESAARLQTRFPILADPEGNIALRFAANEFPAYLLIDPQGFLRRRLVGFRTESALAAMVAELVAPPPAPAALAAGAGQLPHAPRRTRPSSLSPATP